MSLILNKSFPKLIGTIYCDYVRFIDKFNEVHDECIPLRKCNVNRRKVPQSPWITKGMLKSIRNKNTLYKEYLQCPNENRAIKFKTYQNKLNNLIRKSKLDYFYSKFKKTRNNMKETWKTINSIIGRGTKKSLQNDFRIDDTKILPNQRLYQMLLIISS